MATCNTTVIYRMNCAGNCTSCTYCGANYCEYHNSPAEAVTQLVGGHICPNYTTRPEPTAAAAAKDSRATKVIPVYHLSKIAELVYNLQVRDYAGLDFIVDGQTYSVIDGSFSEYTEWCECKMAVWKNEESGRIILGIKGTSPKSLSDLLSDAALAIGAWAESALGRTLNKAVELIRRYNVNLVTGHSLGGYMAEIIATRNQLPGIGFCAPGTNGPFQKFGGEITPGFHNVNADHDVFGNVASGHYTHVQWSIYVSGHNTHSMAKMVNVFEGKSNITNANILTFCTVGYFGYYL